MPMACSHHCYPRPIASVVFALALLISGQNSTLTGTLIDRYYEGFIDVQIPAWMRPLDWPLYHYYPRVLGYPYFWRMLPFTHDDCKPNYFEPPITLCRFPIDTVYLQSINYGDICKFILVKMFCLSDWNHDCDCEYASDLFFNILKCNKKFHK